MEQPDRRAGCIMITPTGFDFHLSVGFLSLKNLSPALESTKQQMTIQEF
jgi:hypothetical protein